MDEYWDIFVETEDGIVQCLASKISNGLLEEQLNYWEMQYPDGHVYYQPRDYFSHQHYRE